MNIKTIKIGLGTGNVDSPCHCFFIVQKTEDAAVMSKLSQELISSGFCRSFDFYGQHRHLWENTFDICDIELHSEISEDEVALTSSWDSAADFVDEIITSYTEEQVYIFYDDQSMLDSIINMLLQSL